MTDAPLFLTSLREVKVNKLAWQGTKHARKGMKLHRQTCLINTQGCITHALTLTHRSVIRGLGFFGFLKRQGFCFVFLLFGFLLLLAILLIAFAYFVGHHQAKKKETKHSGAFSRLQKKAHNFKNTLTQDLMIENYISLGSHKSTSRLRKGDLQITSAYLVSHSFSHIMLPEE